MNEVLRYGLAGVANTIVGYLAFLFFYRYVHWSPAAANAAGYVFGLGCAYLLNRVFVFSGPLTKPQGHVWRFVLAFAIAFALNQLLLFVLYGAVGLAAEWAQIIAMSLYTIAFYLLNKWYVFPSARR